MPLSLYPSYALEVHFSTAKCTSALFYFFITFTFLSSFAFFRYFLYAASFFFGAFIFAFSGMFLNAFFSTLFNLEDFMIIFFNFFR